MTPRTLLSLAPAALAIVLWFTSTLFYFGHTGLLGDDITVAMRDPATGALDLANHPWTRWPYFWRPLHLAHASVINTLSWDHPWIGHLELALIHALVAWMLAGFLVRLGVRLAIARTLAMLFLVCPLVAGAVLWTTTSCNAISALFLLITLELVRRQALGPCSPPRTVWIALLAFTTACWYEPGAAALAAIPLVYLAASDRDRVQASDRWRGALLCTLAAGLGCLLYVALLLATAPPRARGGSESLVALANALPRLRLFSLDVASALAGPRAIDLFFGSIHQGWLALNSPTGIVLAALAACLALPATVATLSTPVHAPGNPAPSSPVRGLFALIGATIFLAAWLPIALVPSQTVALRSCYIPVLGLTILVAGLARGAAEALVSAPRFARRSIAALAVAASFSAALAGTIGMVGLQTQLRLNALRDRSAVDQLRSLLPDPAPGTVFLPLRIDARAAAPGRACTDYAIHSAFEAPWSCDAIVRTAYRRADIASTPTPRSLRKPGPSGFRRAQNPSLVPWDRCVPFTLDRNGSVSLVHRLTVVPTNADAFVIDFPRVPPAPPSPAQPPPTHMRLREVNHAQCVAEELAIAPPVYLQNPHNPSPGATGTDR